MARSLSRQGEAARDRIAGMDVRNKGVLAPNPASGRTPLFQNCQGDVGTKSLRGFGATVIPQSHTVA